MEATYRREFLGQAVSTGDLVTMAENAGLADDHVLAELLRLPPFDGTTVAKAIIPFGIEGPQGAGFVPNRQIVQGSGAADGKIRVLPFRAIIGSRDEIVVGGEKKTWRDIRSA